MFAQRTLIRIANFATNSIGIVFWEGFSIPTNSIAISTIIQMGIVFPSGRPRFRGSRGGPILLSRASSAILAPIEGLTHSTLRGALQ